MAYIVNAEIPKYCDMCPFGVCRYSHGLSDKRKGYSCNLEYMENKRYTKIVEGHIDENLLKPEWCPLEEIKS